jgi:hypothetical protein
VPPHHCRRDGFWQRQLLNEVADARGELGWLPDRGEIRDQRIEARRGTARPARVRICDSTIS